MTEDEIGRGLLDLPDPDHHCLCYCRELEGLDANLTSPDSRFYTDLDPTGKRDHEAQNLLHDLKQNRIPQKLSHKNIHHFSVPWREKGVDPEFPIHSEYLSSFCSQVHKDLKAMIDRGVSARRSESGEMRKLRAEVLHHAHFCLDKCQLFCGRKELLSTIKLRLLASGTRQPLVVYGPSGSGKTSVMAMVARNSIAWLGTCVSVLRFLGTSPHSSSIRETLSSVCHQLCVLFNLPVPIFSDMEFTQVAQLFRSLLLEQLPPKIESRLVIVLDSLDQLSASDGAHTMKWLPKILPDKIRVIVSTLPEEYMCLSTLQSLLPAGCFLEVEPMSCSTALEVINMWLTRFGRTISSKQSALITNACSSCPQPLFLTLLLHKAMTWKSYTPDSHVAPLPQSTAAALAELFDSLENEHGQVLVRRALGYLSAGRSGLTETELEDVLSLDNEVLDDVYQYWDPPSKGVVRIPQLLWKRIRHSIDAYLVEQQADGITVLSWYHRQFAETTTKRYLTAENAFACHSHLVEYFEGTWSGNQSKPVTLSHRHLVLADAIRQVAPQPDSFGKGVYNTRKLNEFPYQLLLSGKNQKLKTLVLCNYGWILTKLQALSFVTLMQDYAFTLSNISDKEVSLVRETLALSAHSLKANPLSLAGQLIGRLVGPIADLNPSVGDLVAQAKRWAESTQKYQLVPTNSCIISPGGPLKTTLSGHPQLIHSLSVSQSHALAVSASKATDHAIFNVWDIKSIECVQSLHSMKLPGRTPPSVVCSQDVMVGMSGNVMKTWNLVTGEEMAEFRASAEFSTLSVDSSGCGFIAGGMEDGQVCVFKCGEGVPLSIFATHSVAVSAVLMCFTGTNEDAHVISGPVSGTLVCRSVPNKHAQTYEGHAAAITCLVIAQSASHGKVVVSGSEDAKIKTWTLHSPKPSLTLTGHKKTVKCLLVIGEDESQLASGSLDSTIRVWELVGGTCLRKLQGHSDGVWCMCLLGGVREFHLVSGSKDDYLKVWDVHSGHCLHTLEGHSSWVSCVDALQEQGVIVSASNDKTVKLWKLVDLKSAKGDRHTLQPSSILLTPQGLVVSGATDGIKVWAGESGRCLHMFDTPCSALLANPGKPSLLVSGLEDGTIRLWDLEEFLSIGSLDGHKGDITDLVCARESLLLSSSTDSFIKLWDLHLQVCLCTAAGHSKGIRCLALAANMDLLASSSYDCSVRLWKLDSSSNPSLNAVTVLHGHEKVVGCITISSDSKLVASGSDDFTLRIWRLADSACLHVFRYSDSVKCVALSGDGALVIAGAHHARNQLRSWDVAMGECVTAYVGHTHAVMCMLLVLKDQFLITGSRDGTIKVWERSSGSLLAYFDLQSQVKYLAYSETHRLLATTTKSGPVAIFKLELNY